MICSDHGPEVFATIRSLLHKLETPARQLPVYEKILERVEDCATKSQLFMPIDVPASICLAHGLDREVLCVSAAASTLLWAGADLMDDVSDGDDPGNWGISQHQLALLYTNLLATLPHLISSMAEGTALSSEGVSEFSVALAGTLWQMSNGQFDDLESASHVQSSADYFEIIRRKAGVEIALFAAAPTMLAGMSHDVVSAWREFGMQFGCMVQLFTDIRSTFADGPHNDLFKGKRTLPVTFTLDTIKFDERASFENELALTASGDAEAFLRAVDRMHEHQATMFSLSRVELLRYRAAAALPIALDELGPDHALKRMVKSFSVV